MSFVYAERTEHTFEDTPIRSIRVYGDTKLELAGAVKANWPPTTRRAVLKYGISKITIPAPKLCVAFAGNNLQYVIKLFAWMEEHSPFDIDDLIDTAYALHCEAPSHDDVEFIICESESVTDGRICCIKGGHIYEDVDVAWIGSPLTFRELQRIRLGITQDGDGEVWPGSPPRADSMTVFAESICSAADDSVGGFVINAVLRDGTFHFNDYLFSQVYKSRLVKPGENITLVDTRENGGYTVEASELDGCPCLYFPQIGQALTYTNKFHYKEDEGDNLSLRHFYLPMLFDPETNTCLPV